MRKRIRTVACATALMLAIAGAHAELPAHMPSMEDMWKIIQEQQAEIESLKKQQATTEQKATAADEKAEAAAVAAEEATAGGGTLLSDRTTIGGYGEMHYNNLDSKEEIDFHRFVLFFGHEFTDHIRLYSEVELEHVIASHEEDDKGEVELEQAYVEFDLNDTTQARGGLFLIPVGILNETHEPPTFYGVERNPVEHNIIPTTWWAGGAELNGEIAPGWSYNVALHEGLKTSMADNYMVRDGRQKTSEADASDPAGTVRIKWTGIPGVEVAGTVQYQSDITQGESNGGEAWLYEAHTDIRRGPFGLRALYARWNLDGDGPKAVGADVQEGYYIEPSWRFNEKVGVFARYNAWDNAAGDSPDSEMRQYNVGINYWPILDVVLKADVQQQDNDVGKHDNGFNLGIGYQF